MKPRQIGLKELTKQRNWQHMSKKQVAKTAEKLGKFFAN
jgi:hypothetical protein